jgi:hypothetical protein
MAATSGCLGMLNPFPRSETSAEFTSVTGMELVEVRGANTLAGPTAEIRVTPEFVGRVSFLVVMDDGEQTHQTRLGTQETTGKVWVDEGLNMILGIQGGEMKDDVVAGGRPLIRGVLNVEVTQV